MGFIRETLNEESGIKIMNYLDSIGIKNVLGKSLSHLITDVIINKERNYYLICRGGGEHEKDIRLSYALCLDGKVINLEVQNYETGYIWDNSREVRWIIHKIEIPKTGKFSMDTKELNHIIREAFIAESYHGPFMPQNTKSVIVEIHTNCAKMIV